MLAPKTLPLNKSSLNVGSDVLASLSIGLYDEPLTIFRELIQNSADAYETKEKETQKLSHRKVDIKLDIEKRNISVKDYALGLNAENLQKKMLAIGQSDKHNLRGFRGIGRLAGLGLCKSMSFRSREKETEPTVEINLDAQALIHLLDQNNSSKNITDIVKAITTISKPQQQAGEPSSFFECKMFGVRRTENDRLLNQKLVENYIAEYCPVPFDKKFSYAENIKKIIGEEKLFSLYISVNEKETICRPFLDNITDKEKIITSFTSLEEIEDFKKLFAQEGMPLAKGWLLHHNYPGALPVKSRMQGIRLRVGNMQIGKNDLLKNCFPEPRFNNWCVGEIHILNQKLKPNTLRSNFEASHILDDFLNCATSLCARLQEICRKHSQQRSKKIHKSITIPENLLSKTAIREIKKLTKRHIKTIDGLEYITVKLNKKEE